MLKYVSMAKWNNIAPTKSLLSETILLAVVSCLVYAMALFFEIGFLAKYGLSSDLIEGVQPENIYKAIAAIAMLAFIFASNMTFAYSLKGKNPISKDLSSTGFWLFALFFLTYFVFGINKYTNTIVLIYIFWHIGRYLVMFANCARKKASISNQLIAKQKSKTQKQPESLYDAVIDIIGINKILLTLVIIVIVIFSFLAGIHQARTKVVYEVMQTDPELAIVRMYKSRLIAVPFNREAKTTKHEFMIFTYDSLSEKSISISVEKLGELKNEDEKQ